MSGYIGYTPFTSAERDKRQHTVTVSQTVINVTYTPNFIDVIINGAFLDPSEYVATSGTSITLNEAITDANDQVTTIAWGVFEIANINPLVWETEITTATDTINVPSNLLGGKEYRFVISIVNDHASTANIALYVNNDTTVANYELQVLTGENAVASAAEITGNTNIAGCSSGLQVLVKGEISAIDNVLLVGVYGIRNTGSPLRVNQVGILNTTTTFTSIDNIQFKASQTTGFGIGTRLTILRY